VTHTGENVATVQITDTVPANTRFVSGCENKVGDALTWTVTVPVGETRTITYTVAVTATAAGTVEGDGAMVNDTPVGCYDLYIEQTLNEVDMKYLEKAIRVLSKSSYNARAFALWAYGVAYTKTEAILKSAFIRSDGDADEIRITAYSYDIEKRVDIVSVYGGDGHYHDVPVEWDLYLPLEEESSFSICANGKAENETVMARRDGLCICNS